MEVAIDSTDTLITPDVICNTSTENKLFKSKSRDKNTNLRKKRKQLHITEASSDPCPTGQHLKSHPLADLDSVTIDLPAVALSLLADSVGIREGLLDNSLSRDFSISNSIRKKRVKVTSAIKSPPANIPKQPQRRPDPSTVPVKARILEGRLKQSYKMVPSKDGTIHRVIHQQYVVHGRLGKRSRNAHDTPVIGCNTSTDSTASEGLNTLDSKPIPPLESDEYVFDSDEYRKWRTTYRFNFDAAATALNHKCKHYATKDNSFTEMTANELRDKMIWMFPPIARATEFLTHFENIRQQQPELTSAVILLPRIIGPGNQYRHLLTKYQKLHTYNRGTYLFHVINPDTLEITVAEPTTVLYDLYLADNTVEERKDISLNSIKTRSAKATTESNVTPNQSTVDSENSPVLIQPNKENKEVNCSKHITVFLLAYST